MRMKNRDKNLSGYIIGAALLMLIIFVPLGTLARMCLQRIPITQYSENILGKYKLIGLNTRFTQAISGGEYMESNEVLLGKDGWMFYKTETDGTPLHDYMGINSFSGDELARVYGNFCDVSETIYYHRVKLRAEKGRPLFLPERDAIENSYGLAVLTVPNKEQVYSAYMPDTVEKISDGSRLTQLTDYIGDKGQGILMMNRYVPPWTYTDISGVFKYAYDKYPLYYKTDTHWTDVGAYLALTKVMDTINESDALSGKTGYMGQTDNKMSAAVLDDVTFNAEPGFVGDLTKISATSDRFSDITYRIDGDSIPDKYKTNQKLLIVGDSFGDSLQHVAKYCYGEVRFLDIKEYSDKFEDELDTYQPDLVIFECVERYLPRLINLESVE